MRRQTTAWIVVIVLVFAALGLSGCSAFSGSSSNSVSSGGTSASLPSPAPEAVAPPSKATVTDQASAPSGGSASGSSGSAATANVQRMIVTTAQMQVRVSDITGAIESIRKLTDAAGGTISSLQVSSNSESSDGAQPLTTSQAKLAGPANASLTLRVPADKLPALQSKVTGLGALVSQSTNADDVTQQHIDMTARLANLRAEEARLRELLNRAGSVSDLLDVEKELARVRGDIESMQQQLAYLENQAAQATLTISLEQPGPIVRPSAGGWGFGPALTSGIQGAAELLRIMITSVIALSPLIVIVALAWWLVARSARKRKAAAQQAQIDAWVAAQARVAQATEGATAASADEPGSELEQPRVDADDNETDE